MADASSFRRGLALFTALGDDEVIAAGGIGVNRLSEQLGMDKGQVSRMLRVLDDVGLVERDPQTRTYRLGWGLFAMAARAGDRRLLELAPPVLLALVERTRERSHLAVLRGHEVVTVQTESPAARAVMTAGWIGRTIPVHSSSAGRALVLDHDLEELEVLLEGEPFGTSGHGGPTSVRQLYERIVVARRVGYAVVDEEFEVGLIGVAAPVRDYRGRIVASLNISAPKFRLDDRLPEVAAAVTAAADGLSRQLGAGDPPRPTEAAPRSDLRTTPHEPA